MQSYSQTWLRRPYGSPRLVKLKDNKFTYLKNSCLELGGFLPQGSLSLNFAEEQESFSIQGSWVSFPSQVENEIIPPLRQGPLRQGVQV